MRVNSLLIVKGISVKIAYRRIKMNAVSKKNFSSYDALAIANLIYYIDNPVDIKSTKTWKYIANNQAAAEISGLSAQERIGLDIHDIAKINKIKDTEVAKVVKADYQVFTTGQSVEFHHIFLMQNGILRVDKVVKKPIFNHKNNVIALLSYANNITSQLELSVLYNLYKQHHAKKLVIKQFLTSLNILQYFQKMPTHKELQTLLRMQGGATSSKHIARIMQISPRTVEEYKSRVRSKLSISFDQLLAKLSIYCHYAHSEKLL